MVAVEEYKMGSVITSLNPFSHEMVKPCVDTS